MNAAPMVNECIQHQMMNEYEGPLPLHNCGLRGEEVVRTGIAMSKSDYGYADAKAISPEEASREAVGLGLTPP